MWGCFELIASSGLTLIYLRTHKIFMFGVLTSLGIWTYLYLFSYYFTSLMLGIGHFSIEMWLSNVLMDYKVCWSKLQNLKMKNKWNISKFGTKTEKVKSGMKLVFMNTIKWHEKIEHWLKGYMNAMEFRRECRIQVMNNWSRTCPSGAYRINGNLQMGPLFANP